MVEKDPFTPRHDRKRVWSILILSGIAMTCVTAVVILLSHRSSSPSSDMQLPNLPPGQVTPEVRLEKWYVIERLTVQLVKQERRDSDLCDVYEVKGQIRRKYFEVPPVATLIVTLHVGRLDVTTKSEVVRDVPFSESKPFTVEVVDPTLARERGSNVTIFVSAHPDD